MFYRLCSSILQSYNTTMYVQIAHACYQMLILLTHLLDTYYSVTVWMSDLIDFPRVFHIDQMQRE